jgi:predicted dehydrogenase
MKGLISMESNNPVSRRSFIKTTAVAAGAATLSAKSYARVIGANDRLNMAFIGCGGMASAHLGALIALREEENLGFLATCDVYKAHAEQFSRKLKEAGAGDTKVTQDYREVLAMNDVDYVLVATPEHAHCYLTLAALEAGKHVYCEKPLTHNIEDSLKVVKKAKETGLKLQVGVQATADDSYSSANAAIKAGKLGPVVEAQIDYVRNYPASAGPWRSGATSKDPKPADLDWDAWLKPAKKRPWDARRYHDWRCYSEYSGGIATDLFVHRITRIIKACDLTFPERAVGMGGIYLWPDGRDLPDNFEMMLEYPAVEGITPGMTVHVLGTMANQYANPHCIRGHAATLVFTGSGWDIIEEKTGKVLESHKKTGGEDIVPHHKNHHAAIRTGAELNCPPELGMYGVAAVRMANLSWFKRKMVRWDARRGRVTPT